MAEEMKPPKSSLRNNIMITFFLIIVIGGIIVTGAFQHILQITLSQEGLDETAVKKITSHFTTLSTGITIGGAIIVLFIAMLLSKKITSSVKKLIDGVTEIARGNLDTRIDIVSQDELGQLAEGFNYMAEQIKTDITERRQAQKKLAESEERYRGLVENTTDAIMGLDLDTNIVSWNKGAAEMLGYKAEEVIGKLQAILVPEEFRDFCVRSFREATIKGYVKETETVRKAKDGKIIPVEMTLTALNDDKGEHIGYVSILRDITERKQAEEKIKEEGKISSSLLKIFETLNVSLNEKQLIGNVMNIVPKYLKCNRVSILLYDEKLRGFVASDFYGFSPEEEQILSKKTFKKGDFPAIDRVLRGDIVIVNDAKKYIQLSKDFVEIFKVESAALMPIFIGEKVGGILVGGYRNITPVKARDESLLKGLADGLSVALENAGLYKDLQQLLINTITSFASAIDAKSPWTKGHSERVTQYAVTTAKEMGLEEDDIKTLELGGLLHDIGKIGTYDVILDKPDELNPEEQNLIKKHPSKGVSILEPIKQLNELIPIIKYHHERIDGKGYPEGLKGEKIPLLARILCVADAYDSMTADRPYRKSPGRKSAIAELKQCSGTQFDPKVVKAFLKVIES